MRIKILIICLMILGFADFASGEGFFEVLYSGGVSQQRDFDGLKSSGSYGFIFGYDTEISESGVFIDIEFGYEMSTHKLAAPLDNPDYYYRNHRGFLGGKIKYGGWGYVRPFFGMGTIAYAYYEASDAVSLPPVSALDYEIEKNMSGSYSVVGIDFYFSKEGTISLGIERRTMFYKVKDTDTGSSVLDAKVVRTAVKFSVLF